MAISVDWGNKIINIPKADTTLVDIGPPEIRSIDLDALRLTLKDLEDGEDGMPFLDTHQHFTEITLQGDTYARVVEFINGYTVEFEDGTYTVRASGANSNLSDVKVQNQVSIDTRNSGGLITGLDALVTSIGSKDYDVIMTLRMLLDALATGKVIPPGAYPGTLTIRDGDDTKDRGTYTVDTDGSRTPLTLDPD